MVDGGSCVDGSVHFSSSLCYSLLTSALGFGGTPSRGATDTPFVFQRAKLPISGRGRGRGESAASDRTQSGLSPFQKFRSKLSGDFGTDTTTQVTGGEAQEEASASMSTLPQSLETAPQDTTSGLGAVPWVSTQSTIQSATEQHAHFISSLHPFTSALHCVIPSSLHLFICSPVCSTCHLFIGCSESSPSSTGIKVHLRLAINSRTF